MKRSLYRKIYHFNRFSYSSFFKPIFDYSNTFLRLKFIIIYYLLLNVIENEFTSKSKALSRVIRRSAYSTSSGASAVMKFVRFWLLALHNINWTRRVKDQVADGTAVNLLCHCSGTAVTTQIKFWFDDEAVTLTDNTCPKASLQFDGAS